MADERYRRRRGGDAVQPGPYGAREHERQPKIIEMKLLDRDLFITGLAVFKFGREVFWVTGETGGWHQHSSISMYAYYKKLLDIINKYLCCCSEIVMRMFREIPTYASNGAYIKTLILPALSTRLQVVRTCRHSTMCTVLQCSTLLDKGKTG